MHLLLSIILSFLLALLAYVKKSMTNSALLCAFLFSCIITYYGGFPSFLILLTVFLGTIITKKIKTKEREKINSNIIQKPNRKDLFQIIANVGIGTFLIIMYALTKNFIFLVAYGSSMSESLSDTLASDLGVLSKKDPINILTLKKGQKGLSGNISTLGFLASCFGSLIIGLIFFIFYPNITYLLTITFSGILGSLFDSILGASIQVKYKCTKCYQIVEKETHCNHKTSYYKGIKFINNDFVNLTSNIASGLISILILALR